MNFIRKDGVDLQAISEIISDYIGPSHLSGQKIFQVPKNEIFHTENRFLGTLKKFLTG